MKSIILSVINRKEEKRIAVKFDYDPDLVSLTKKIKKYRYSPASQLWHFPCRKETLIEIKTVFESSPDILVAEADGFLEELPFDTAVFKLQQHHHTSIAEFKYWLRSKRYSDSTIETYLGAIKTFLAFHAEKALSEIIEDDIIKFNNEYILERNYSASYQNQVVNAIKLFFKTVAKSEMKIDHIHRPKRPKLLPNVLSKDEVKQILTASKNIKHRAMLSLLYSCGLRRSELLNLRITDVDSGRKLLIVRQSKNRKDRIVPLSEKIIDSLREYYKIYQPKTWLFEGQVMGTRYSEKSLENVLKQAVARTDIGKPVSLHWLRHSYATHLLESGTNLRYIQEILGHSSSRTTEIYTHVSTVSLQQIKSPFDDLGL